MILTWIDERARNSKNGWQWYGCEVSFSKSNSFSQGCFATRRVGDISASPTRAARPRVTVTHSRRQRTPKGNEEWMKRWMNSLLLMNEFTTIFTPRPTDQFLSLLRLLLVFLPFSPSLSLSLSLFYLRFTPIFFSLSRPCSHRERARQSSFN